MKTSVKKQCTGKAGGVQTESRPGFDRRQYDRADNKVIDFNG